MSVLFCSGMAVLFHCALRLVKQPLLVVRSAGLRDRGEQEGGGERRRGKHGEMPRDMSRKMDETAGGSAAVDVNIRLVSTCASREPHNCRRSVSWSALRDPIRAYVLFARPPLFLGPFKFQPQQAPHLDCRGHMFVQR